MTIRYSVPRVLLCLTAAMIVAIGCGKTDSVKSSAHKESAAAAGAVVHDHGDGSGSHSHDAHDVAITEADVKKPADYKDAVARIKAYRKDIEVAAGSDVPGKAHRPLDELDIVLKWLPGIARDSNIAKDQWETINTGAQQLREMFEKVHGNIDNKKNPDFPAVAKAVDEIIARLEAAAGSPAKK